MPFDANFGALLDRKYDLMRQETQARANLENTQAGVLPSTAASEARLRAAQAALTGQQAGQVAPLAQSQIAQAQAGIGQTQAQTGLIGAQTRGQNIRNQSPSDAYFGNMYDQLRAGREPGYARGTSDVQHYDQGATHVPGQGDGTVDKVPAVLAPGEAVLNKAAAEHVGRGTITALNAMGAAKMGMPAGKSKQAAKGKSGHFAGGIDDVRAPLNGANINNNMTQSSPWGNPNQGQNVNLRQALGMGAGQGPRVVAPDPTTKVVGYAGGTDDVRAPLNGANINNNMTQSSPWGNQNQGQNVALRQNLGLATGPRIVAGSKPAPGYARGTANVPPPQGAGGAIPPHSVPMLSAMLSQLGGGAQPSGRGMPMAPKGKAPPAKAPAKGKAPPAKASAGKTQKAVG